MSYQAHASNSDAGTLRLYPLHDQTQMHIAHARDSDKFLDRKHISAFIQLFSTCHIDNDTRIVFARYRKCYTAWYICLN